MSHSTTSKRKTLKSKSTRNNNSSKGPATDVPPHKNIPSHLKYPNYRKVDEATVLAMAEGTHSKSDLGKTKPSLMLKDLRATKDQLKMGNCYDQLRQRYWVLNIEDYSAQKQCHAVGISFSTISSRFSISILNRLAHTIKDFIFAITTRLQDVYVYCRQTLLSSP